MDREELAAWLRLDATPGLGNVAARRLLAAFGLPQAVFEAPSAALQQMLSPEQTQALRLPPQGFDLLLDTTWAWLQERDAAGAERRFVPLGDAAYPAPLLAMPDPPLALYLLGRCDLPAGPALAMVGSRNPTPQGIQNAKAFASHFAASGMTVVSGLALGIDGASHEGALDGAPADGGTLATIAVVGTGLDRVYPRRHLALAHRIAARGLLVSEYPLGTPPLAHNFPKRNRIIAGLSLGTLVVEAAKPSGSLITAHQSLEQGKEVFAIPGSIHSPQSRGCHALIRQGAKLVESAQDVLEELRLPEEGSSSPAASAGPATVTNADAPADDPLLEAMGYEPVGLDALVARTGIAASTLQVQLLELELADRVVRLPGGLFQRIEKA